MPNFGEGHGLPKKLSTKHDSRFLRYSITRFAKTIKLIMVLYVENCLQTQTVTLFL